MRPSWHERSQYQSHSYRGLSIDAFLYLSFFWSIRKCNASVCLSIRGKSTSQTQDACLRSAWPLDELMNIASHVTDTLRTILCCHCQSFDDDLPSCQAQTRIFIRHMAPRMGSEALYHLWKLSAHFVRSQYRPSARFVLLCAWQDIFAVSLTRKTTFLSNFRPVSRFAKYEQGTRTMLKW